MTCQENLAFLLFKIRFHYEVLDSAIDKGWTYTNPKATIPMPTMPLEWFGFNWK